MARKKRSPLPSDAAGSSRPPKRRKSTSWWVGPTSNFSENTAGHSMLEFETLMWKQNRKIEELQMMTAQKIEEFQTQINELKERLNKLENATPRNQTSSEQVVHDQYESRIEGTIKEGIFTGSNVEGKNGELLKVAIYCDDNSSWVDEKWLLGIRLLDTNGLRVLEAISNFFRVLDRNWKGSEKSHPPLLTDGVERLEKVGKKRASDLQEKEICTINDFLQLFHMNSSCIFQILGISSESDEAWKTMIGHAKECGVGPNLYAHRNNSSVLIFNPLYAFLQMLIYSQSPSRLSEAYIIEVLNILNDEPQVNITSEWNNDNARKTLKVVFCCKALAMSQPLRRDHLAN